MPHLLAYQNGSNRHLARWNRETAAVSRHLGGGTVTLRLQRDNVAHYTFGGYKHVGNVDVAVGYTDGWNAAGERTVASTLYGKIEAATSEWPYMGNDWAQTSLDAPCFWHVSGGVGISQTSHVGTRSEACMSILAHHFSLPPAVASQVENGVELSARVLVKGIGSWVEPNSRNSNVDLDCDIPTIEKNPNHYGGSESAAWQRRIQFETYNDALSLGVHVIGGDLVKSRFSPKQCFYVKSVCPDCGAVRWFDLHRLCYSHYIANNGEVLTAATLNEYYAIDMADPDNAHFLEWKWHGSRGLDDAATRFNSRPSCEGRHVVGAAIRDRRGFNSRPSCEGRHPIILRSPQQTEVSIHAPRVRGDWKQVVGMFPRGFQFTPLV